MESDCAGCCGLFPKRKKESKPVLHIDKHYSKEHLLGFTVEEVEKAAQTASKKGVKATLPIHQYRPPYCNTPIPSTDVSRSSASQLGSSYIGAQYETSNEIRPGQRPAKVTHRVVRSEDAQGNKMINDYVRVRKIGIGSYGKVVLHRSLEDGMFYALKIFHKSRLCKLRVSPSETAMMDVLREVMIMKQLDHPNIVKLIEVIDDPESDNYYMVLEYVEGGWIFEGCGPSGGIGEANARVYCRDVVAGLMYLHKNNIIHGDIKPENLLVSADGHIKICDFGVSRKFEDGNDELRRSPGTPVYTAPECCLGLTYHGKAADVWALGCTLYCMVLGSYPFKGDNLQSTYDKIVNDSLYIPDHMEPDLADLLTGLLCKDACKRLTLEAVANHLWVVRGYGPVQ
ncbi:hypothetical protein M758_11G143500 [Ceratodon purpureus]|nr:hypothetical protein M758_11G143500 [Ceratodon purpureus]